MGPSSARTIHGRADYRSLSFLWIGASKERSRVFFTYHERCLVSDRTLFGDTLGVSPPIECQAALNQGIAGQTTGAIQPCWNCKVEEPNTESHRPSVYQEHARASGNIDERKIATLGTS